VSREYAVATTWLIRLGVLTLLFGIGFFLKYSIDRNWLSPLIRVSGMTVAGIAAVAFGLWQQSGKYRQMAIAAIGGGFTVLYLSVLAAYKLYAMLPDTAAFTLMVIITAAAMLSSIYSKALLAAMIGCIGGFLTPDFIYSGNMTGNTLMIYLTIISAGVLLISVFRDWILLNITALFFYAIFSWSIKADNDLIFNTLLMLNFVIYALQPAMTARKRDISILGMIFLAVNWSLGYFNGAANCSYAQYQYTELFIALSAIVSVGLIYIFKSCKLLANRPCFAGVFFLQSAISLALLVPELLKNAPACTLIAAWCLSALFFTWWGLFERSRTLIVCSQLLMLFTFIYEIIFPASFGVQFDSYLQAITVRMTVWGSFIAALTLIGTSMCYYSKRNTDRPFFALSAAGIFNLNQAFLLFALYSGAEIFYLLKHLACFNDYHTCIISSYWSVLAAVSAWCSRKLNRPKCLVATLVLVLINTVFLLTNEEPYIIKADYFKSLLYMIFTGVTYTGTLFFAGRQISKFKQPEKFSTLYRIVYLVAGLLAFAISSSELFALLDLYLKHFRDGGLSVYWSILAFCLIFRGIKKRIKALRISGILLFILTAVKVFFQDLSGLQQLWRIVAFVIIGAAMLVGAVIYIKCKDMF
ncbi:MAG: DUF2339 domain-containing protein, partial [Lentisphaeria bacterium]|nr:DUF2339 domain-containing protein [Lentisphaeria bacterium]